MALTSLIEDAKRNILEDIKTRARRAPSAMSPRYVVDVHIRGGRVHLLRVLRDEVERGKGEDGAVFANMTNAIRWMEEWISGSVMNMIADNHRATGLVKILLVLGAGAVFASTLQQEDIGCRNYDR
jgi:hypothetical protein